MKSVTGIYKNSKNNFYRFWLSENGLDLENLGKRNEKELLEDPHNPLWLLRHSLGKDHGPEDFSHYAFDDYVKWDRDTSVAKSTEKGRMKDLSFKGLKVPVPSDCYSHSVGPIHAGIIGPGHFRFIVKGQKILNLDIRLGFQKRDLLQLLIGKSLQSAWPFSEVIAGDSTIGYSIAFSKIYEKARQISIPVEIELARTVLLELERIANHVGDLGGIAGDIGFYPLQGFCANERGAPLNAMEILIGNRFGRGGIRPGSIFLNEGLQKDGLDSIVSRLKKLKADLMRHFKNAARTSSVRERLQSCGIIPQSIARANGLVGMAEKACGFSRDLRLHEAIYSITPDPIRLTLDANEARGDAWARFYLRYEEIVNSCDWLIQAIPLMDISFYSSDSRKHWKPGTKDYKPGFYFSAVEAWRGPVLVAFELDANGKIIQGYIRDPSVLNWHALEVAVRGELIGDFPLNNKSFNLSYSGVDL